MSIFQIIFSFLWSKLEIIAGFLIAIIIWELLKWFVKNKLVVLFKQEGKIIWKNVFLLLLFAFLLLLLAVK